MYGPCIRLTVDGLQGGHSGADIHLKRANANKIMGEFMSRIQKLMPLCLTSLSGGAKDNAIPRSCQATLVAMGITLLVNFVWKISAHCIGIGGLLGGLMGVSRIYHLNPYPSLMAWILLAGMLATSRLYLEKHTPTQVYIGFCLGFICTFASSIVSYIYLFI